MNLHSIVVAITTRQRSHPHDFILDLTFFNRDANGNPINNNYGSLVEVWVEEDKVYGIWADDYEHRWLIYVYEYNNEYDKERLLADGDRDFACDGWWVDTGHIPE